MRFGGWLSSFCSFLDASANLSEDSELCLIQYHSVQDSMASVA